MRAMWLLPCLLVAGCGSDAPQAATGEAEAERAAPAEEPRPDAVNSSQPPGEAATAAVPAAPAERPLSASGYRLIGTEPFWGGSASGGKVVYSTPENQAGDEIPVTISFQEGREIHRGTLDGARFILTLTPGPCSDGMSDNVHAFTANLEVKGEVRQGCADPRP